MSKTTVHIIITSVEQQQQAQYITEQLLTKQLAACIQQTSGLSTYHWQGKLQNSREYYLHIKTRPELTTQVIDWLEQHHPYNTPEIITIKAQASLAYSDWLYKETQDA
ncbi:MAG: divalent-cation tolerance protein CutA [Mariprofundaceae bacterium]